MTYLVQTPYTTLTPNLASGSDPSRGPAGNPVVLRRGQTLQNLIYRSTQSQGALRPTPNPVALADCHVVITVTSVDYPDPTAVANDLQFDPDIVQINNYRFRAGYDFGVGEGHGAGTVNAAAASLGAVIANSRIQGVVAVVVSANDVGLFLRSPFRFSVKALSPAAAIVPFGDNFDVVPDQVSNMTGSVIQAAPFI